MRYIKDFFEISSQYDAFLLDLWGVIHDGEQLYPMVSGVLERLYQEQKKVIFLSNAPRRAENVARVLQQLGIKTQYYHSIVTSGEAAYNYVQKKFNVQNSYYFLGPEKDAPWCDVGLLDELKIPHSPLEKADFILNVGFENDFQPLEELLPRLQAAIQLKIPMICANPDIEVVKQNGTRIFCAGLIAKEYEKMGGEVEYFGKPYAKIYQLALKQLKEINPQKILAVGDSLETDIAGAGKAGLDCALITGGILKNALHGADNTPDMQKLSAQINDIAPNYVLAALGQN